jgi:hypothetical protein
MALNTPPGVEGPLLELCGWCDEDTDGAAGRLIAMFAAGLTAEATQAAFELVMEWYREVMASRGWYQSLDDEPGPGSVVDEDESFTRWEVELVADPEAEQRIHDLYQRLLEEEKRQSNE